MDFLRKWLVGRDLKRARALEGEGYIDRALPVYESCLEMASEAERLVALRGIGSCGADFSTCSATTARAGHPRWKRSRARFAKRPSRC